MPYRPTTRLSRPVVFTVMQFRQSIRVYAEMLPAHAALCEYDLAFHAPRQPWLIIFPWFREGRDGWYPVKITAGRWRSYSMALTPFVEGGEAYDLTTDHSFGHWITYQRSKGSNTGLEPVTLNEWLKARPSVSIRGWRKISVNLVLVAN